MIKKIIAMVFLLLMMLPDVVHAKLHNIKDVESATVMLVCRGVWLKNDMGGGSASRIYHEPNGPWVLLTANHVMRGCEARQGTTYAVLHANLTDTDGSTYNNELIYLELNEIATDGQHDLAIVETRQVFKKQYPYYAISPVKLSYLQLVWAAGFPGPFRWPETLIVTPGSVNAPAVSIPVCDIRNSTKVIWGCDPYAMGNKLTYIYGVLANSEIGPGNSGGTLFNENLEIVGVTVAGVPMGNMRAISIPTSYINTLILKTKYADRILRKPPR